MAEQSWGNLLRIGVFYDGQYFRAVSNYYHYVHDRKARISLSGLHEFIKAQVSNETGRDARLCQIIDAHYFSGRFSAKQSGERNDLYNDRVFDDILMYQNIVTHYMPFRTDKNGRVQEKGIDVWLALEAYELAIYKRFDIIVLIACDGDYVPLVRKLNTVGCQVMLLSWDFEYTDHYGKQRETRTSQSLLEEVSFPIAMHERIDSRTSKNDQVIDNLFVPPKETRAADTARFSSTALEEPALSEDAEQSEILKLKGGFGFIKNSSTNNVFFYHDVLEGIDFNDLEAGMPVLYTKEKQEDGSYVATKVRVLDQ
ncbi:MAG: NYN domain-containing protein [Coriobacteriia bacterium]|nr:NYN domain-containing protein [Coriobacteriia bacterium]